jgi:hypothetical protein
MKFASTVLALLAAVSASANPFAAKSKNSAKAAYYSKLMRGAKETPNSQLRRLDQEEYWIDISGYSMKFEMCQFVKTYDDELAENEEYPSVLGTKRFVVFRLCPDSDCSSCNYNYGEYIISLDEYLEATVAYQQELQQDMCDACNECGQEQEQEQDQQQDETQQQDEGGRRRRKLEVDCDTCYDECQKIENMEENGYVDATEFLECQMIYDPEDDGKDGLYAGPMCANSGTKIKIGVFTDENCNFHDSSKSVDDYLMNGDNGNMQLSHALLKTTYSNVCISCKEPDEEDQADNTANDANNDADNVNEMCEALYDAAGKCEKHHGFDNGYANYDGYENQYANEEIVCDYIESLLKGTYDEDGEIVIGGSFIKGGGGSKTTGGQKFALTFFILGTVALAVYAGVLHSKLTKGGKADLSRQGGAMA